MVIIPAAGPQIERGAPRDLTDFANSEGDQWAPGFAMKRSGQTFFPIASSRRLRRATVVAR
jgi:hypothetical protein